MEATTRDGLKLTGEIVGEGPPVVLVMGLGMPGAVWNDVREGLVPGHQVVTYDNRGFGGSEMPTELYSMGQLGDDIGRVMDAVGWDTAHVVGVSLGGMAAQQFAVENTERLRSLTLIATHSGGIRSFMPTGKGLMRIVQSRVGSEEARTHGMGRLLYPKEAGVDPSKSMSVRMMVQGRTDARHQEAVRLQLRAVFGHRTRSRLHRLAGTAVQVIRPGADLLCRPSNNDKLAADIPGAVLKRFDGDGHGIVHQNAVGLAEAIADWVGQHEG